MNAQSAQDGLNELRRLKDVTVSTVDAAGNPRARIIDMMLVEKDKIIFCTARGKHFYNELTAHPMIAITALNEDWQSVRLTGEAKRYPDDAQHAMIDRIFDENPSMNDVYPGDARYILEAFAISSGKVDIFDLGQFPIVRHNFAFGDDAPEIRGFFITDTCIGCDTCASDCPQQAIDSGDPYVIRQDNCLHCGLCFENCPVSAIVHREDAA